MSSNECLAAQMEALERRLELLETREADKIEKRFDKLDESIQALVLAQASQKGFVAAVLFIGTGAWELIKLFSEKLLTHQ